MENSFSNLLVRRERVDDSAIDSQCIFDEKGRDERPE